MKIEKSQVTKLELTDLMGDPYRLDPVSIYLEDFGPNPDAAPERISRRGKIVVSCWGESWTAYWGAMGDRTVAEFFCSCDEHYIIGYFQPSMRSTVFSPEGLIAMARKSVIDRRMSRDSYWEFGDSLERHEARELWNRIDDELDGVIEHSSDCTHHSELMSELFGDEWFHMDLPTEPNTKWDYLCRVIRAVQDGLREAGLVARKGAQAA